MSLFRFAVDPLRLNYYYNSIDILGQYSDLKVTHITEKTRRILLNRNFETKVIEKQVIVTT